MKKILLASAALILCLTGAASASALFNLDAPKLVSHAAGIQLAKDGGDDGADHDAADDHGGTSGSDNSGHGSANSGHGNADDADETDDADEDDAADEVRIPGGSGCDSAEDIAEHSECSAAQ